MQEREGMRKRKGNSKVHPFQYSILSSLQQGRLIALTKNGSHGWGAQNQKEEPPTAL
jgi:hypothetical protein